MCRWLDQLGSRFNETIVAAMERDAKDNAFCIATDATGFAVQPGKLDGRTTAALSQGPLLRAHRGPRPHPVQLHGAPAQRRRRHAVQGLRRPHPGRRLQRLQRALPAPPTPDAPDDELPTEVGCWSHARRKFFEAAFAKLAIGREGLVRLHKIFEVEQRCRAGKPPPSTIKARRLQHLAPLIDEFIDFAKQRYEREKKRRGPACAALGLRRPSGGPPARRAHGRAPAHRKQLERARAAQGGPHPRRCPVRRQHRARRECRGAPDAHRLRQAPPPEPPRVHPRPDPRPPLLATRTDTSSSRRSSGTRRAPGWTPPSSRPRSDGSPCPTRFRCAARARNRPRRTAPERVELVGGSMTPV
jgi:hypothetical protein